MTRLHPKKTKESTEAMKAFTIEIRNKNTTFYHVEQIAQYPRYALKLALDNFIEHANDDPDMTDSERYATARALVYARTNYLDESIVQYHSPIALISIDENAILEQLKK